MPRCSSAITAGLENIVNIAGEKTTRLRTYLGRLFKGFHDIEVSLSDMIHGELTLRWSQANLDAFEPAVYNDNAFVSEEAELIC